MIHTTRPFCILADACSLKPVSSIGKMKETKLNKSHINKNSDEIPISYTFDDCVIFINNFSFIKDNSINKAITK